MKSKSSGPFLWVFRSVKAFHQLSLHLTEQWYSTDYSQDWVQFSQSALSWRPIIHAWHWTWNLYASLVHVVGPNVVTIAITVAKVLVAVFDMIELQLKKGVRWVDPGQMRLVCSKVSDLDLLYYSDFLYQCCLISGVKNLLEVRLLFQTWLAQCCLMLDHQMFSMASKISLYVWLFQFDRLGFSFRKVWLRFLS